MSDFNAQVQSLIDELSSAIVMADAEALETLTPVCQTLEQLGDLLEESQPAVGHLARVLGLAASRVAAGEGAGIDDPFDLLARGVALLQNAIQAGGRSGWDTPDREELMRQLAVLAQLEAESLSAVAEVPSVDPEAFACFAEEAEEHLSEAERTLLALEQRPGDAELLHRAFRAFHTLKGAAAYPNLPEVIRVAHAIENGLDAVRSQHLPLSQGMIDVGLEAVDLLKGTIAQVQTHLRGGKWERPDIDDFLSRVEIAISQSTSAEEKPSADAVVFAPLPTEDRTKTFLEDLAPLIEAANLDDLSTLAQLQLKVQELSSSLSEKQPMAAKLAAELAAIIEKIILEECGEPQAALDWVLRGFAFLEEMQKTFADRGVEPALEGELVQQLAALSKAEGDGLQFFPTPEAAVAAGGGEVSEEEEDLPDHGEPEAAAEAETVGVDADLFLDFRSEAEEHLSNAESTLLALETQPGDVELLNSLFRAFHTIKGASGFLNLNDITRVAHAIEDLLDAARKGQSTITPAITDVILASIDLLRDLLKGVEAQLPSGVVRLRDISAFVNRVAAVVAGKESTPRPKDKEGSELPAPASDGNGRHTREQLYVRVDTEKLDLLVNAVGELVIAQTQVAQNPDVLHSGNQKLSKDIAQLMKISTNLQEISMGLRMIPIKATFERMARLVRDLTRKCGKQVEFRMRGEETELDKNVVEEIVDPLTHMVRNAVDHGIELPAERLAVGKPEKGQITLEAYHKGGHIVIELSDDGRGINRDRVLEKARERGLVSADEKLSDDEILKLIFHPGLSTAEKISDVSGRGVGMDVVRRNIEQLRGKVEVQSTPGRGSVFTIKLPLTLAIIDGMVIGVGTERYILPLTSIISSLRPRPEQIATVLGRGEMIKVQEELFPLVRLHDRFGVAPRYIDPCQALVVLIEAEGKRCCLMVDELIGLQQVVIKGLSEELRRDPCLSGCAILGDGRVGLILDANGLVEHAHKARTAKNSVGDRAN